MLPPASVRPRIAIGLVLGAIGSFALGVAARAGWDAMGRKRPPGEPAAVAAERAPGSAGAAAGSGGPGPGGAAAGEPPRPAKPARTEHVVWKLVDNRHLAHRFVDDELVVDASGVGLARYARFGVPATRWHYGHTVGGERPRWRTGSRRSSSRSAASRRSAPRT